MDIKSKILSLNLPKDSFIVVGSGILQALGIRDSDDIDMVVSQEAFGKLDQAGWQHDKWSDQVVLKRDEFDIGTTWAGEKVGTLLQKATVVEGIPYLSLADLRAWKSNRGRPKDLRDIELIDDYLTRHAA